MAVTSIDTQFSDWASQLLETVRNRNNGKSDDLADKLMGDLDTDGNSALSLEESGLSESAFTAADTDGDGKVSAQELADALAKERAETMAGSATQGAGLLGTLLSQAGVSAPPQGMGQMAPPDEGQMAEDIVSSLDQDGDSALSLDESGLTEEVFNSLDTDGDGVVSATELAEGLKAEREKMTAEGEEVAGAGGAGGATASNASADTVLQSLLQNASQAAGVNPMDLRKALQAYGNNLLTSALGQYDGDLGVSFSDYMSSGQMSLLNFVGTESVDYTV